MSSPATADVELRDFTESDLPTFFEHQSDSAANRMAAFTRKDPSNREAFEAHWRRLLADRSVVVKTILFEGGVAGSVAKWEREGKPEVTYWIGREHWGKGIATIALSKFLKHLKVRPIYASAARDNVASVRVLEKCGFRVVGSQRSFAEARGEEIEEVLMELSSGSEPEQEDRAA